MRLFSFFFLLVLGTACQKPEQSIGIDALEGNDELTAFQNDTLAIHAFVEKEDSVRVDELTSALLGSYTDPAFGHTQANFCTQVRLSGSNAHFPENFEVDSVVLALVYANKNYYGQLLPAYFNVYELSEDLSIDSVYYSNRQPLHTGENLILAGHEVYDILPKTKVAVKGDTLVPQLRLHLDHTVGQRLMAPADPAVLQSNTNFKTYFKGLYVNPLPWNTAVVNYDIAHPNTKLTVYYRNLDGDQPDTTYYDFVITSDCARYSYITHDYAGTPLNGLSHEIPLDGTTYSYIQAGGGIKTRIDFPSIKDLNRIPERTVHKVELIIPFEPDDRFYPQEKMFLLYKNKNGVLQVLPDQISQTIGGNVNTAHHEYRFNISRYIQALLNGQLSSDGLYILSSSAGVSVNRVLAHGPGFSVEDKRENMRLVVTISN